ncbi:hypothetical protein BJ742DRAFT_830425 [Cladochytrium replicatum]|nr:hypothetical protein BJ742DRAFT_830425 [Cladochytrium replicatum]
MPSKALLMIMTVLLLFGTLVHAADYPNYETSPECECYCCPSASNPRGKNSSCSTNDPPLAGTVKISVGGGTTACNENSCSAWFAVQCPPSNSLSTDIYAACIPYCTECGTSRPKSAAASASQSGTSQSPTSSGTTSLDDALRNIKNGAKTSKWVSTFSSAGLLSMALSIVLIVF